jgi:hypothetical protein
MIKFDGYSVDTLLNLYVDAIDKKTKALEIMKEVQCELVSRDSERQQLKNKISKLEEKNEEYTVWRFAVWRDAGNLDYHQIDSAVESGAVQVGCDFRDVQSACGEARTPKETRMSPVGAQEGEG